MSDVAERLRELAFMLENPIPPDVEAAPSRLREAADYIDSLLARVALLEGERDEFEDWQLFYFERTRQEVERDADEKALTALAAYRRSGKAK